MGIAIVSTSYLKGIECTFLSDFSKRLKLLGGNGLFFEAKSTSNLYTPDKKAVRDYIDNFSSHGICNFLEQRLSDYHESKYCVLFSTGFWALVAAIKLKALTGKNEVIVPSLTYRRLADVVYWAGLVPVFVDVEADTLAICPNSINTHISGKNCVNFSCASYRKLLQYNGNYPHIQKRKHPTYF